MGDPSARSKPSSRQARLEILDRTAPRTYINPVKRIHEGGDVSHFLTTFAYRDIVIFLLQLNHAVCPRKRGDSPLPLIFPLTTAAPSTPSIQALQTMLADIESLVQEAPPDPGPRRFGNVSFRKWCALLEEGMSRLLSNGLLGDTLEADGGGAQGEVSSYLLGSFGSAQRMDYGTGHELSFLAFLGCLWKLGYFQDGAQGGDIEREIVLSVIEP
jgi:serine/threonine-protein phosphatase 2A activator